MNRQLCTACFALLVVTCPAELPAGDDLQQALDEELALLRAEVEKTRREVAALGTELRRVRAAVSAETAATMDRWKRERDELRRERLALSRETQHLAHERAEVARLSDFHRSLHPRPQPPRPGEPIALSGRGNRPRYTQAPVAAYPPASVYVQPPFFFNNYVTPDPCLGYPSSALFFRFHFNR